MSQFYSQGPVPLDSIAYVEREFETNVTREILSGRWVLLLGPRQHGKTTGIVRIKSFLRQSEMIVSTVDLQRLPPLKSYEELLSWFAHRIAAELSIQKSIEVYPYDRGELSVWLEKIFDEGSRPITIIIDEASSIQDNDWRNAFYGQIRSISTSRADSPPNSIANRLRFIFSGTFRPDTLVSELNSPFNVCERIDTEDLDVIQIKSLFARVTGKENSQIAETVFSAVGGQPYLVQKLFAEIVQADEIDRMDVLNAAIENLRHGNDEHFRGVFSRIFGDGHLSAIVSTMAANGFVENEPASHDYRYIQTLGIAKREGHRLVFRNSIYRDFAQNSAQLVPSEQIQSISPGVLIPPERKTFSFMLDDKLADIVHSAYQGAVHAYNSGSYRLALVGFGAALEGILIDWLVSLNVSDLSRKINGAGANFNNHEDASDPHTWRLINLIKVGRNQRPSVGSIEPTDIIREWRNLVHPANALQNYMSEEQLEPEARTASGMFSSILRDLSSIMR